MLIIEDPRALYEYGCLYYEGEGGFEKNFYKAYSYFKEAAKRRHLESIKMIEKLNFNQPPDMRL